MTNGYYHNSTYNLTEDEKQLWDSCSKGEGNGPILRCEDILIILRAINELRGGVENNMTIPDKT